MQADRLRVTRSRFRAYSDAIWLRLACSPLPGRLSLALAALDEHATRPPACRTQERAGGQGRRPLLQGFPAPAVPRNREPAHPNERAPGWQGLPEPDIVAYTQGLPPDHRRPPRQLPVRARKRPRRQQRRVRSNLARMVPCLGPSAVPGRHHAQTLPEARDGHRSFCREPNIPTGSTDWA